MQRATVVAQEVLAGVVGTLPVGMNQGAVVVAAGMPTSMRRGGCRAAPL